MLKRNLFSVSIVLVLVLSFSLIIALPVRGDVSIDTADGGGAISADTAANAAVPVWTILNSLIITENIATDIAASQDGVTLVLNVPAGFQFNAGQTPSISGPAGDITAIVVTSITAGAITITFTTDIAADAIDTITIGDTTAIQVQPTLGTPLATGNITKDGGSTSIIAGIDGTTNFGTLTMVAGAVATLTVEVQPSDALVGVAITPPVQVRAVDAFTNNITGQDIGVTLQAGTGVLSGTTPQSTNTSGIAAFDDLSINLAGPGKQLRFTAGGKTVDSNPFSIIASEIDVKGNGIAIADGGLYDYGSRLLMTDTDITFTIENTGTSNLTLTIPIVIGGANNDQFSIQQQPVSPVAAAGNTTFIIRFTPTTSGLKTATISIANNDADENPYDLIIQGMGIQPTPAGTGTEYNYNYIGIMGTNHLFLTDHTGKVSRSVEATSPDGTLTINIPKGTIAKDENGQGLHTLEINVNDNPPPPPGGANIIGLPYSFGPDGATFDPPITLTFYFDPDTLPAGVTEDSLVLAYYDEAAGEWVELTGTVDTVNNRITATISHFTTFAIVVDVAKPPAEFSLSDISIQPAEIQTGGAVTVTVSVTNTGGTEGDYNLYLKVNGIDKESAEITLAAGQTGSVNFILVNEEAGTYNVDVNGLADSYVVTASPEKENPAIRLPAEPDPAETQPPITPPPAEPSPTATPPPPTAPAPTPSPATNWWLIGGIIAGVIIVGIITWRLVDTFRRV